MIDLMNKKSALPVMALLLLIGGGGNFIALKDVKAQSALAQSAFDDPGARNAAGASGDLAVVDPKIDGGIVALGASSQVVVLLRNDSARPLITDTISLYPSSNVSAAVSENECGSSPLPPQAICAIALSVKGLQPGNFRIEMLIRHDGKSKLLTSTISGEVDSASEDRRDVINDLETIPDELSFGTLTASRPLTRSLILRNVTSKAVTIDGVTIESNEQAGYSYKTNCESLQSGAACVVTVTWAPLQKGPATGALVIHHNGPTGVVSVLLDGLYDPTQAKEVDIFPEAVPGMGLLTASQRRIDFGNNIEAESTITVSLVNIGDAELELENIRLAGEDTGVSIAKNGCKVGTVLKPVEACPLTIRWEPVRVGSILDDVQITHNGARGVLVLPVTGGASKAINRDSKSIVFGEGENFLSQVPVLSTSDLGEVKSESKPQVKSRAASSSSLEGYKVTSLANNRAIIAGPGGSRVVFNGEETVIGGVLWKVGIKQNSVEFRDGSQRVVLLFDKSLSSGGKGSENIISAPAEGG